MEYANPQAQKLRYARRSEGFDLGGLPSHTTLMERSRTIVARSTCTNDTDDGCKKPTVVPTLAIVCAVIIPIVIAIVVLFFLHRRNVKKLRAEDANEKYKSLDFGIDPAFAGKKKGGRGPEMSATDAEKSIRGGHGRGLSLDMDTGNPYMLPAGLHGSRESFHSLSRSTKDPHDPYRPVTFIKDDASIRSGSRNGSRAGSRAEGRPYRHDNGSMYTASSAGTDRNRMNDGLLKNAQRMSQSYPLRAESTSPQDTIPEIKFPEPAAMGLSPLNPRSQNDPLPPPPPPPVPASAIEQPPNTYTAFQPSGPAPSTMAPSPQATLPQVQEAKAPAHTTPSPPPRVQSQEAVVQNNPNTTSFMSTSSYGDGFQVTPPSPPRQSLPPAEEPAPLAPQPRRPNEQAQQNAALGVDDFGTNSNRLSMSLRPLPPDDPNDNPEQRANRIRSFYKEYFDDSKPEPAGGQIYNDYYEDYGSEYLDGTVFDPHTGNFIVAQPPAPFAQPVTRRAMTPPPRAPPRFRSNTGPRGAHMSGSSMASSNYYPPRGMSSMSGRLPQPRKPMPPPSALNSLPTPAKLKEDAMVFNSADFAPPVSFRERQNGMRPDSPLGNPRPFSPAVRPHTPLASSFDDLAVLPSPHMLRKSGNFTALDFAPPGRIRDPDAMSDAGSIRSNRSGMSHAGRMAVRKGAYRVSRIPKEVVGTRDDISTSLRPRMDMVAPA